MESLYQLPSKPYKNNEQRAFWAKVISDQSTSGMSLKKFCRHHQLSFAKLNYWKYSKQKIKSTADVNNTDQKSAKNNKDAAKFISLQIAADATSNERHKNVVVGDSVGKVGIIFKNGHKILLPLAIFETNLSLLIKIVSDLRC